MGDNNSKERRHFTRTSIEHPIIYTMDHNDDEPCSGTSQNISASGIYITTNHAPKLDTEIRIVLHTEGNHSPPLIIEGKVVRCRFDKKDPNLFHVSIEFANIHQIDMEAMTVNPSS